VRGGDARRSYVKSVLVTNVIERALRALTPTLVKNKNEAAENDFLESSTRFGVSPTIANLYVITGTKSTENDPTFFLLTSGRGPLSFPFCAATLTHH